MSLCFSDGETVGLKNKERREATESGAFREETRACY
jgi:hypothetical protein